MDKSPQLFRVNGMTCQGCVAAITEALRNVPELESFDISLDPPILKLEYGGAKLDTTDVSRWLPQKYAVQNLDDAEPRSDSKREDLVRLGGEQLNQVASSLPPKNLATYWPLILVVGYILIGTVTAQYITGNWHWAFAMRIFMGLFFVGFSFFKLLDLNGFAQAYQGYDWIARSIPFYGKIYPFVELGLGCAYLVGVYPLWVNCITLVVMTISIGGVIETVVQKRSIRCACLGTGFNLPMSQVTIIEDGAMIVMAAVMIFWLTN